MTKMHIKMVNNRKFLPKSTVQALLCIYILNDSELFLFAAIMADDDDWLSKLLERSKIQSDSPSVDDCLLTPSPLFPLTEYSAESANITQNLSKISSKISAVQPQSSKKDNSLELSNPGQCPNQAAELHSKLISLPDDLDIIDVGSRSKVKDECLAAAVGRSSRYHLFRPNWKSVAPRCWKTSIVVRLSLPATSDSITLKYSLPANTDRATLKSPSEATLSKRAEDNDAQRGLLATPRPSISSIDESGDKSKSASLSEPTNQRRDNDIADVSVIDRVSTNQRVLTDENAPATPTQPVIAIGQSESTSPIPSTNQRSVLPKQASLVGTNGKDLAPPILSNGRPPLDDRTAVGVAKGGAIPRPPPDTSSSKFDEYFEDKYGTEFYRDGESRALSSAEFSTWTGETRRRPSPNLDRVLEERTACVYCLKRMSADFVWDHQEICLSNPGVICERKERKDQELQDLIAQFRREPNPEPTEWEAAGSSDTEMRVAQSTFDRQLEQATPSDLCDVMVPCEFCAAVLPAVVYYDHERTCPANFHSSNPAGGAP